MSENSTGKSKIVFLCSGGGGNLKFLFYFLRELEKQNKSVLNAEISSIICDRYCGAFEFGEANNIPVFIHTFERTAEEDEKLISLLKKYEPDFIITNVHKILSERILKAFKEKLINLHYSLLPGFAGLIGMKPVQSAIKHGSKFIGATCHKVSDEVDMGYVLAQSAFILPNEPDPVEKMFRAGCITLFNGMLNFRNIKLPNLSVYENISFSPSWEYDNNILETTFELIIRYNASTGG